MIHIQERIQICTAKIIQNNPQVKNIFDEIYQQGGRVLLVGGAVRDCLLGCLGSDLDFEVYHLSFEELQAILQKFGKVSFVGKSFGVLRLHGFDADWSIPRIDSYGRKPSVELNPNMSFEQAFRRRDLTINAMGIDVYSHELIDPFNGIVDLKNKILRSPDVAFFVQDPLRLFRVMQLSARFEMQIDQTLSQVCRTMDISTISQERIEQEFIKLFLKSQKPSIGLTWLQDIERISEILPMVRIDSRLYDGLDCLAQHDNMSDDQKLLGSWVFIATHLEDVSLQYKNVHEKVLSSQLTLITTWLKNYIGSHDLIHQVALLSWYIQYMPQLVTEHKDVLYKWLAHWITPWSSLQILADISICFWSDEIVEAFIIQAKTAKVLYHQEEPLLVGKDLLPYVQGKELGELLKQAYAVQLESAYSDKHKLLQSVMKKKPE